MLYRAFYMDGSEELLDADTISEARERAEELYDSAPLKKVKVVDESTEDEDPSADEEDSDTDSGDESDNPEEEGDDD